jgi:hypothetical protein
VERPEFAMLTQKQRARNAFLAPVECARVKAGNQIAGSGTPKTVADSEPVFRKTLKKIEI